MIIPLILIFTSLVGIITLVFWEKLEYKLLPLIAKLIIWTLPFERIPSIPLGGSTIRFSQILTLIGGYIFIILVFKKDKLLYAKKINPLFWYIITFVIATIPSFYMIVEFKRFAITYIATLLTFGTALFIAHFCENIYQRIIELVSIMIAVSLFAIYQVVGDLVGVPLFLTGLDGHYSKITFGIARAQGTALEPLYFAGILFLPWVTVLVKLLDPIKHEHINQVKFPIKFLTNNYILLLLFTLVLLLTISKSAIAIVILAFFVIVLRSIFCFSFKDIYTKLFPIFATLGGFFVLLNLYIPRVSIILKGIFDNLVGTINGISPSSEQRNLFIEVALKLIPDNIVFGIGSGQYGVLSHPFVWYVPLEQYLIVNNVYLEVLLEFGIIAFLVFLLMLVSPIYKGFNIAKKYRFKGNLHLKTIFILTTTLIMYCIQWFTFSPIFIMPIFIILGLLMNELYSEKKDEL
jgi:O-antigen ligase